MKKVFLIISILLMTGIIIAQSRQRKDLRIYKDSPGVYLMGTGALIDFNQGDLVLTQSTNALTLTGGNLALGTNNLLLTGSIGATGTRVAKGWFTNLELTNLPTIAGASLSALYTSGDIAIGVNNLTLTGSIATTGSRVTKGWFTNIESTNMPTVGGVAVNNPPTNDGAALGTTSLMWSDLFLASGSVINWNNGNVTLTHSAGVLTLSGGNLLTSSTSYIGIGATSPLHKLVTVVTGASNLNAFNFVNGDVNKNRSTVAQATDSASISAKSSSTGNITFKITTKIGATQLQSDSLNLIAGTSVTILPNDTTVAKAYGKLVFKSTDSTLYVCKYIRPTGKKCWFKLDN